MWIICRLVEGSPPPDVEYYLINGRPKRRRTTQGSTQGMALPPSALAVAPSSSNADAGKGWSRVLPIVLLCLEQHFDTYTVGSTQQW